MEQGKKTLTQDEKWATEQQTPNPETEKPSIQKTYGWRSFQTRAQVLNNDNRPDISTTQGQQ